jgi:hypothetical protein
MVSVVGSLLLTLADGAGIETDQTAAAAAMGAAESDL